VVFDEHVNIHDLSEAAWRLGVNIDPRRDILFVDGPADDLDHAASTPRLGSKVGIDATEKIAGEGVSREWPEEIVMSGEIKSLVDSRWGEYGL
jgi:4-hydroxy-3-polyprenylbenzoate decarboxylase